MLYFVLSFTSILWFVQTSFYHSWSQVKLGGDQLSFSISAMIIVFYMSVAVYGLVKWYIGYYSTQNYNH